MTKTTERESNNTEKPIERLREILWGKNQEKITQPIQKQARELVSQVVTEALKDRQIKDGSIDKVLQPVVEKAIERSLKSHTSKIVDQLYPLLGTLIRKSVAAFISEFLEKTNAMIENSLTPKSLLWRISARKMGISFSEYVALKTFNYRVKQIFFIHRESGLLLNSQTESTSDSVDGDSISAMLTAINDFVSDSFSTADESIQNLAEVKTDNFTLLICVGPSAILAGAIQGVPPQDLKSLLQVQLEMLHKLYYKELSDFQGDTNDFVNSEPLLRECLISQLKNSTKKQVPWYAAVFVFFFTGFLSYWVYLYVNTNSLAKKLKSLDEVPGYVIQELKVVGIDKIKLTLLADPQAINLDTWLAHNDIDDNKLTINTDPFISLEPEITLSRVNELLVNFPTLSASIDNGHLFLQGNIQASIFNQVSTKLENLHGVKSINTEKLVIHKSNQEITNNELQKLLFFKKIQEINSFDLSFERSASDISAYMANDLQQVYFRLLVIDELADKLNLNYGLIVIGTSDGSGTAELNQHISLKRANNALSYLTSLGVNMQNTQAIGMGELQIVGLNKSFRKVLFNVVYTPKQ